MSNGKPLVSPGAYDNLTKRIQADLQASGVVLVVLDGSRGSGCSVRLHSESQRVALVQLLTDLRSNLVLARDRGGPIGNFEVKKGS